MHTKQSILLPILLLFLTRTTFSQTKQGILVDKIMAKIGQQVILKSELEEAYQQQLLQAEEATANLKRRVLDKLLINKLLLVKAKMEGITVTKEEVEADLKQQLHYFLYQVGSEEKLAQYWGKPIKKIKEELKKKSKAKYRIEKMWAHIIQDMSITPTEVKNFFDALPAHKVPYYPAEVELRQLVRYPKITTKAKEAIVIQLKDLKKCIQAGDSFTQVAKTYSEDTETASKGGMVGFVQLGGLEPAYEATALALKEGDISDPVETPFGFHLIQLIERKQDCYNSRHILISPKPSTADLEAEITYLNTMRTSIIHGAITFENAVREASEDSLTAAQGGLLTRTKAGKERMPVDALDPAVFFTIEKYAPGDISQPTVFTAAANKQGVRLLCLKQKIPPHQANLQQDYENIRQMALESKQLTALKTWFEATKDEVVVSVDPEY